MISDGLLVWLGTYGFWAGGAFALLYADLQKHPPAPEEWGPISWGLACLAGGALTLPFYFWSAHNTGAALLRGIFLGILVTLLTLAARVGLSLFLQVPLA
ncbi:MAG: hypothetical protein RMJ98_12520 [Myxococcales bacterium]|nr:hypothetical protein [Polyangiaceae bacterium]MDW8250111.1 hypothetical protein [Myxococcales bacterium]